MKSARFTRLELRILEVLWNHTGGAAIREVQEAFPENKRPAYTTIQATVYRLEKKQAVRRVRKIGNAHIFEATVSRSAAHRRLIDEFLALFGGRAQPVMAHWIESGHLTREDVEDAERLLREIEKNEASNSENKEGRS